MKKSLYEFCKSLLVIVVFLMLSTTAKADINYTFIKMTCDPDLQSATIKVFYDWGDAGKARVALHEKDTYYLDDIASGNFRTEQPKKITCNLNNTQTISFVTYHGLPKDDNLVLFIDKKRVTVYQLGDGEWSLDIRANDKKTYTLEYCPAPDIISLQPHARKCEVSHVSDGIIGESKTVE